MLCTKRRIDNSNPKINLIMKIPNFKIIAAIFFSFFSLHLMAQDKSVQKDLAYKELLHSLGLTNESHLNKKTKSLITERGDYFSEILTYKNEDGAIEIPYFDVSENLGDINGDGNTDFFINRTIRDNRTASLSDNVIKNVIFYGGDEYETEIIYDLITPIGDFNGDGYDDVILGQNTSSTTLNTEQTAIYLGGETPFSQNVTTTMFEDSFQGDYRVHHFDINNDTFEDIIIFNFNELDRLLEIKIIKGSGTIDSDYLNNEDTYESISIGINFFDTDGSITNNVDFSFVRPNIDSDSLNLLVTDYSRLSNIKMFYDGELSINNIQQIDIPNEINIVGREYQIETLDYNGNGTREVLLTQVEWNKSFVFEFETTSSLIKEDTVLFHNTGEVHVIGDINNDGYDDLFVENSGEEYDINLHLGSSSFPLDRSLSSDESFAISGSFNWLRGFTGDLYDVNNDSFNDFVIGYRDNESGDEGLAVLKGNGSGTYTYERIMDTKADEHFRAYSNFANIGDFNGDGEADAAYVANSQNEIGIYFSKDGVISNTPDIIFEDLFSTTTPLTTYSGDFNGDGLIDIGVGTNNGTEIGLILGTSDGSTPQKFTLEISNEEFPYRTYDTFFGDLDGDGKDELLFGSYGNEDESENLLILKGGDEYKVENLQVIKISEDSTTFFFGGIPQFIDDINGDGLNDILINDNGTGFESKIIFGKEDWSELKVDIKMEETFDIELNGSTYFLAAETIQARIDFNGDGFKDLSAIPVQTVGSENGTDKMFVWFTGPDMDNEYDLIIPIQDSEGELSERLRIDTYEIFAMDSVSSDEEGTNYKYWVLLSDYDRVYIASYLTNSNSIEIDEALVLTDNGLPFRSAFYQLPGAAIQYSGEENYKYNIWLTQNDNNEALTSTRIYGFDSNITSGISVGLEEGESIAAFKLNQNYPNPFNPSTEITFSLPKSSLVRLEVFNVLGQKVETLVNEQKIVGNHTINFDASRLSSGIYIYRIQAGDFVQTKKMLLVK